MISRRQVIGSGLAVSALSLGNVSAMRHTESLVSAPPTDYLVVDTRFSEAIEIAARLATTSRCVIVQQRDVLGLWYDRILPTLRAGTKVTVTGVTTSAALFAWRTLAADHRLRVVSAQGAPLVSWVIAST
jgi:hypothetical protein